MTNYTAINIGPIIKTLGMARKPRELWAASYLFSYLMKRIILAIQNKGEIISPATINETEKNEIGLYPDRVFVKDGELSFDNLQQVLKQFSNDLRLSSDYFNVMMVSGEYDKDSAAIKDLNTKLDRMELFNMAEPQETSDYVRKLIDNKQSKLFEDAFDKGKMDVETLGEIAAVWFKKNYQKEWEEFKEAIRSEDSEIAEKAFDKLPKKELKSYHKYICVVQADGDNVGGTVCHEKLPNGKVKEISNALLNYGKEAKKAININEYGGLTIYAGGDDLLFIAPVVGENGKNIFDLLNDLDNDAFGEVKEAVESCKDENGKDLLDKRGKPLRASLSFGVSITYYKYPLYEALESARHLLFDKAKKVDGKNAVVVEWRKHSGSSFFMEWSNSKWPIKKTKLNDATGKPNNIPDNLFEKMITASSVKESVVSAVAHKIRESEGLISLWSGSSDYEERNRHFFEKYMDYDPDKDETRKENSDKYKDSAKELMNALIETGMTDASQLTQTIYGMLRVAKFINGEEVHNE